MAEQKKVELKNADVNFNQYGDDSSAPNQATAWWMNQKYTGEGTQNSNIAYNNSIKTADLDPEYVYGWDAQVANSNDAGYIARRNDNIASALYNEGKKTKEDVVSFLASQKNWNNSTEADRFNTVESVWKRIWDISEQNDKDNTEIEVKEMEAEKKEEPKGKNVNVNTFLQGTTTELFGKMITWADTAPYDHSSIEWKKAEARLAQYQKINSLTVEQLASSIKGWSILSGWQAMRDLQTYNPEKYQQLQDYQKQQDALDQINMISSGNFTDSSTSLQNQTWESINNYLNETVANAGGDALARMDLDTALSQNQGLVNYAERMSYYQAQINQIDQTIGNLAEDARKRLSQATGENVPEYMIQNYINNRSKKLYKQRDNLLNQYNYYKWVYEAQVEQEATAWERDYKERQLKLQENKYAWDQKMDKANLDYKYDQLNYDYDKLYGDKIEWTGTGKMRTERNNNPTAMTTDVAKTLWLVEWVDYVKWDSFKTSTWTLYTAKLLWDPIETTIKALDTAVANGKNAFYTQSWWQRRSHTAMSNEQWKSLSDEQKRNVVLKMLQNEWGDITKMSYYNQSNNKNDELFTKLQQRWISFTDMLEKWEWDETLDEVYDYIWKKYSEKNPITTKTDLNDYINKLSELVKLKYPSNPTKDEKQAVNDEALFNAQDIVMNLLNKSKLSNKDIIKMVWDYGMDSDEKVDLLSIALKGKYKTKQALNDDLSELKSWWDVWDWGWGWWLLDKLRENIK